MEMDHEVNLNNLLYKVIKYKYTNDKYRVMKIKNGVFSVYEIKNFDGMPNMQRKKKIHINDLFQYYNPVVDRSFW